MNLIKVNISGVNYLSQLKAEVEHVNYKFCYGKYDMRTC